MTTIPYFRYYYNEANKIVVELNGTVYNNCTSDVDCPDSALCYHNASWSAYPSQCTCWTLENLVGERCREFGWYKNAWYAFSMLMLIFSAFTFFGSLVAWFMTMRIEGGMRMMMVASSLNWTYLFVLVASATLFLQQIFLVLPYQYSIDPTTGYKRFRPQSWNDANVSSEIVCFFFASLATLNVSLVWLKVHSSYARKRGGGGGRGGGAEMVSEFRSSSLSSKLRRRRNEPRRGERDNDFPSSATPVTANSNPPGNTARLSSSAPSINNPPHEGRENDDDINNSKEGDREGMWRMMMTECRCSLPTTRPVLKWFDIYATTLLVYYAVFFIALCYFWVNGNIGVVSWFGAAAILFVAFTYAEAYRRLRSVFTQFTRLNSELQWQYGSISFAAGTISLHCFAAFSALIAYIATGQKMEDARSPAKAEAYLVISVFWFLVTLIVFWVFFYLAQTLRMKIAKRRRLTATLKEDMAMRARMNVASIVGAGADVGQYSPRIRGSSKRGAARESGDGMPLVEPMRWNNSFYTPTTSNLSVNNFIAIGKMSYLGVESPRESLLMGVATEEAEEERVASTNNDDDDDDDHPPPTSDALVLG